jgi:hypothetical protein
LLLAYETDFDQEFADKGIATWSFEREYILEYGVELFTQAVSQHAPRAMKSRSHCFRFYPKNGCCLLDACFLHVTKDEHSAKCRGQIVDCAL